MKVPIDVIVDVSDLAAVSALAWVLEGLETSVMQVRVRIATVVSPTSQRCPP